MKAPSITYGGVQSKHEGTHIDLVVLDDPEGADAEKSDVANEASYQAYQTSIPLLEEQRSGQILVVGTPWGQNPLVYRLLENETEDDPGTFDNSKRYVKVFWRPLLKANGEPYDKHRYPPHVVEGLKKEPIYDTQYALLKKARIEAIFDLDAARHYAYEWIDPGRVVSYISQTWDKDVVNDHGFIEAQTVPAQCSIKDMRFFTMVDPTHKLFEEMKSNKDRPSMGAVVTVGIAPDFHAFVVDVWHENTGIEGLAEEAKRQFYKWGSDKLSVETTGAQVWFKDWIRRDEKQTNLALFSLSLGREQLAQQARRSLYANIVEPTYQHEGKKAIFVDALAPWVNRGFLHFDLQKHGMLLDQMEHVANKVVAIDALDALAQGPAFWEPGAPFRGIDREMALRKAWVAQHKDKNSGYIPPRLHNPGAIRAS